MTQSKSSRFVRYTRDNLQLLLKLDQGDEFTKTLIGVREYTGSDGPAPILDLEDPKPGDRCGRSQAGGPRSSSSTSRTRRTATSSTCAGSPTRGARTSTASRSLA